MSITEMNPPRNITIYLKISVDREDPKDWEWEGKLTPYQGQLILDIEGHDRVVVTNELDAAREFIKNNFPPTID